MQLDEITYAVDAGVAAITLDRPAMLNAISGRPGGTRDQIVHAIGLAESDPDVGCIVLAGNGKAFCGGGDLTGNARRHTEAEHRAFLEHADAFHRRITTSAVPVVAAVHGYCLGAGLLLAASCDFVVAGEGATFGFPEGRLGLVGAASLTSRIGRQWATFLMVTGESVTAERASEIGLVLTIEPDDELDERVRELARRISRMPRESVVLNRRTIQAAADAAGDAAARAAALDGDTVTLLASARATAPDGRTFRSIIESEGMDGLKRARAAQYDTPWLRP
jgi:enoyl-CoA hydratase/carnithine racemase